MFALIKLYTEFNKTLSQILIDFNTLVFLNVQVLN
jgi:hypothetical protein